MRHLAAPGTFHPLVVGAIRVAVAVDSIKPNRPRPLRVPALGNLLFPTLAQVVAIAEVDDYHPIRRIGAGIELAQGATPLGDGHFLRVPIALVATVVVDGLPTADGALRASVASHGHVTNPR